MTMTMTMTMTMLCGAATGFFQIFLATVIDQLAFQSPVDLCNPRFGGNGSSSRCYETMFR